MENIKFMGFSSLSYPYLLQPIEPLGVPAIISITMALITDAVLLLHNLSHSSG